MKEPDELTKSMEEFLEQGQKTLNSVNKAINLYKYIFGGILLFLLGITLDTRVEVVRKVDASEVQKEYVNKADALNVHKLEKKYVDDIINCALNQGITIETQNNEWIIESILNKNYKE